MIDVNAPCKIKTAIKTLTKLVILKILIKWRCLHPLLNLRTHELLEIII